MTSPLQSPLQPVMRSPLEFRRRGGGSFDIASTNPSAYYDRTNLATLFQDYPGTTPVTATGQTIGLGLDQSQGLELGPELAYFSSTTLTVGNTNFASITDTGLYYFGFSYDSGAGTVRMATISVSYIGDFFSAPASRYVYAQLTAGDTIRFSTATAGDDVLSGITCKRLLGYHQLQATAGKRPITDGSPIYANFDAVDDDLVATFPASLGAGCTVCRSLPGTGASITTGVTLTDTYTDNVDAHALLIYTAAQWAALDAGQIANITTWLNRRAVL